MNLLHVGVAVAQGPLRVCSPVDGAASNKEGPRGKSLCAGPCQPMSKSVKSRVPVSLTQSSQDQGKREKVGGNGASRGGVPWSESQEGSGRENNQINRMKGKAKGTSRDSVLSAGHAESRTGPGPGKIESRGGEDRSPF